MKNALLLLVILAASVSPVAAQSSADGLDSTLVAYYRWCNRHKQDPEMLLKADTMFRLAGEKQNRRMQAVALCLKTDYYYYTNKFDSVKVWVARPQQFPRQHNQPTHYYFVWTRLISYYTKYSKYTLAQYELERFLDQAIRDDYKPAIAEAYKHLGHIYRTKSLYNTAIDTYLKAIDVAERNGLKEVDVSDLYLQLGEMYTQQRKYDQSERALRMAEKTILLPEHIWRVRIAQANLHAEEGEFARARQLLREIRDGSNGYASENKIREIELSIYKHSGELHKALEIVNKQLAPYEKTRDSTHYFYIPMLGTRAAINYELGNYKASAEDLSRQMALAQKKYDQSNRETLNEFATLFDVERLDREKAEAQQQAQAERLRRARVFEISLGVILLLASIFIFILTRLNRRLAHAKHAAEQASRMKGVFIRNITHEINTPLNAIVGFAELASTAPENDPERDAYIDIIRENSGFLQKLVDDVLYIADLESSDTPPVSAQADINACCRECIRGLSKHGMAETAIRFLPEREKFTAGTSCVLLTKALTELLRNAVRFTGQDGTVSLSYAVAQDGRSVTFAVEDSGPGVPEGEQEHIFDRFVKIDPYGQGLGLGLSVCRLIARTLGGDVRLDTRHAPGARFLLTIPVE